MIDPIYGGFTGALKTIATRFKLGKPPTDIRKEAEDAREIELNVEIGENNNNQIERGKYKIPTPGPNEEIENSDQIDV
jgi:hypothetical protein